jgi:hypothetical protein
MKGIVVIVAILLALFIFIRDFSTNSEGVFEEMGTRTTSYDKGSMIE